MAPPTNPQNNIGNVFQEILLKQMTQAQNHQAGPAPPQQLTLPLLPLPQNQQNLVMLPFLDGGHQSPNFIRPSCNAPLGAVFNAPHNDKMFPANQMVDNQVVMPFFNQQNAFAQAQNCQVPPNGAPQFQNNNQLADVFAKNLNAQNQHDQFAQKGPFDQLPLQNMMFQNKANNMNPAFYQSEFLGQSMPAYMLQQENKLGHAPLPNAPASPVVLKELTSKGNELTGSRISIQQANISIVDKLPARPANPSNFKLAEQRAAKNPAAPVATTDVKPAAKENVIDKKLENFLYGNVNDAASVKKDQKYPNFQV